MAFWSRASLAPPTSSDDGGPERHRLERLTAFLLQSKGVTKYRVVGDSPAQQLSVEVTISEVSKQGGLNALVVKSAS